MAISGMPFGLRTIYPSLKLFTMFIYAGAKEFLTDNIENVTHGRPKLPSF
jgi:predicted branched-subunit amino acid permease